MWTCIKNELCESANHKSSVTGEVHMHPHMDTHFRKIAKEEKYVFSAKKINNNEVQ